jgi:hypothetical protein
MTKRDKSVIKSMKLYNLLNYLASSIIIGELGNIPTTKEIEELVVKDLPQALEQLFKYKE